MSDNINCIILCAGAGTRMNNETKNKVCFEILGKPAVVRVIETLKECGVHKFVVVVGHKSKSVMNAVADIEGVAFAYQKEQAGTGNAAMCGLRVLNDFKIDGPVLVVMGDKLIDKSVFTALISDFKNKNSDVSLITQPADFNKSGGKIVICDNKVIGIVEHMDVLLLKVREALKEGKTKEEIFDELNLTEKQISKIDKKLKSIASPAENVYIDINGVKLSSSAILSSNLVNCATYLYKREAIENSILSLDSDNAQNEIYFTDTIKDIAKDGKVSCAVVPDKNLIQTFNTIEELEDINKYYKEESENGRA